MDPLRLSKVKKFKKDGFPLFKKAAKVWGKSSATGKGAVTPSTAVEAQKDDVVVVEKEPKRRRLEKTSVGESLVKTISELVTAKTQKKSHLEHGMIWLKQKRIDGEIEDDLFLDVASALRSNNFAELLMCTPEELRMSLINRELNKLV